MARPIKSGVDYFPLDVNIDDKIELLEAEHGIIGFGILIKLYQKVYANNYWINWNNKSVIVFSSRINVDKKEVIACINSCFEWGIFDKKLHEEHEILTSRGIQKRFFEITKRRKELDIVREYLLVDVSNNENIKVVNVNNNSVNADINSINVRESTQSKVKKKESKEKEIIYTEPFLKLFKEYPNTNGSKSQTFKNYKSAKKKYKLTDDQLFKACLNSASKQKSESKNDDVMYLQLSNVLGQKYGDDLKELLDYKPVELKQTTDIKSEIERLYGN